MHRIALFTEDAAHELFLRAIVDAGRTPLLGGLEYVADLVGAMDLEYVQRADDSLGRLVNALREAFAAWVRG